MIRWFIHFYDSLNIVFILDPGCEFFYAKCFQYTFNDKPYQEVNFKSYLSSALFCK